MRAILPSLLSALFTTCGAIAASTLLAACGGGIAPNDAPGDAPPMSTAPIATTSASYPSGMVAAYGPGGAGVSFFSYGAASGFTPLGALNGAWQTDACEQIAFDAKRNLYLTCTSFGNEPGGQVVVFPDGSMNDAQPSRIISGPSIATSLLVGSAVDSKGNVYVVAQSWGDDAGIAGNGAVVVFGPGSDSQPIRVIEGPSTQLTYPNEIAIDADDDVYVGTAGVPVVVFAAGANGDASPVRTIGGGTCGGTEGVAVDGAGRVYIDCVPPSNAPTASLPSGAYGIAVFGDDGGAERLINGPASEAYELLSTAVDGAGRIFVGDFYGPDGGSGVYVYGPDATGDVPPEATLSSVSGLAVAVAP